ncbi:phosphoglyceromutase [Nonomuraea sp. M3C6]|uniref:2,3-bisphosphoglycerate-dependent phosphoglycerate mutase n=1 Tax=Nonomuraea marmarensis TaxID=3351344 RepID=A0ABW7AME9_9ACTN
MRLVLLRHGESEWNSKNLFTGWVDVDLTPFGEEQARQGGRLLHQAGLLPTVVHTSLLTRAVRTGNLALEAAGRVWIPARRHWRLNERHYGALQGKEKRTILQEYGEERFRLWRRSYDVPPPDDPDDEWHVRNDPRYAGLPRDLVPRAESLADVVARLLPYWYDVIAPDLRAGYTVLVVAHSNSLRALVAHLDRLDREEVMALNIPTGIPLRYDLDDNLEPVLRGGRYLDPEAAAVGALAVADQGR